MVLKALVLTGFGINCEQESRYAIQKSGASADIMHMNKVVENPEILESYNMLMIPGGFSFGDDLGSGKVLGNKMRFRLHDRARGFHQARKPHPRGVQRLPDNGEDGTAPRTGFQAARDAHEQRFPGISRTAGSS